MHRFFENITPDFMGKVFNVTWKKMGAKKLQFLSTQDIGYFGALAFQKPEQWHNRAISLAGDELTFAEGNEIFRSEFGTNLPTTFGIVFTLLRLLVKPMDKFMDWCDEVGPRADIDSVKSIHPGLQDFRKWLSEGSMFRKGQ